MYTLNQMKALFTDCWFQMCRSISKLIILPWYNFSGFEKCVNTDRALGMRQTKNLLYGTLRLNSFSLPRLSSSPLRKKSVRGQITRCCLFKDYKKNTTAYWVLGKQSRLRESFSVDAAERSVLTYSPFQTVCTQHSARLLFHKRLQSCLCSCSCLLLVTNSLLVFSFRLFSAFRQSSLSC